MARSGQAIAMAQLPQPSEFARLEYRWTPLEPCSPQRLRARRRCPSDGSDSQLLQGLGCTERRRMSRAIAMAQPTAASIVCHRNGNYSRWRPMCGTCNGQTSVGGCNANDSRTRLRYGLAPGKAGPACKGGGAQELQGWSERMLSSHHNGIGCVCVHVPAPSQWRHWPIGCIQRPWAGVDCRYSRACRRPYGSACVGMYNCRPRCGAPRWPCAAAAA